MEGCSFFFKEGEDQFIFIYLNIEELKGSGRGDSQKWRRFLRRQETIHYTAFYIMFVLNYIVLPVTILLNK